MTNPFHVGFLLYPNLTQLDLTGPAQFLARAPGANDAVVAMYTLSKMMRDHMLPHSGTWTLNETILASGQATADNLAAQMAMIMFAARAPDAAMLQNIHAVLDRNAAAAAAGDLAGDGFHHLWVGMAQGQRAEGHHPVDIFAPVHIIKPRPCAMAHVTRRAAKGGRPA